MRQGPDLNRGAHGGTIEDEALALVAHVIKQGTQVPMRPTSCTSRREDVGMSADVEDAHSLAPGQWPGQCTMG